MATPWLASPPVWFLRPLTSQFSPYSAPRRRVVVARFPLPTELQWSPLPQELASESVCPGAVLLTPGLLRDRPRGTPRGQGHATTAKPGRPCPSRFVLQFAGSVDGCPRSRPQSHAPLPPARLPRRIERHSGGPLLRWGVSRRGRCSFAYIAAITLDETESRTCRSPHRRLWSGSHGAQWRARCVWPLCTEGLGRAHARKVTASSRGTKCVAAVQ